jgi:2-phospho-L-lactate guanylyltransferase
VVLLPLKALIAAKSRLAHPDRATLALAMALDTADVAAALGPDVVARVVVVTSDPTARAVLTSRPAPSAPPPAAAGTPLPAAPLPAPHLPGRDRSGPDRSGPDRSGRDLPTSRGAGRAAPVVVLPERPDRGLNQALRHAARAATRRWPGLGVVALSADLAALRPAELRAALEAAPSTGRALVADADGTGTVLLCAAPGSTLRPLFGAGSRASHVDSGALDLTDRLGAAVPGLRRDVDTLADLAAARLLGVGPATAAVLAGRHPRPLDAGRRG